MNILGIETSCDETSVAIVENGTNVRALETASSVKEQAAFGGVIPEVAARRQLEFIMPVISAVMAHAGCTKLDAIAVTKGPGLLTSLLVGTATARILASVWKKPLIGVHHTLGHLSSAWLACAEPIAFPILALSVSGGHTELWFRESHTRGMLLGRTRDDAAGEAFDKGAMLLSLPYPGGPAIGQKAEGGNPHFINFPSPLKDEDTCDFSYSGLKTSLKYAIRDRGGIGALSEAEQKDVAASYEEAICRHLVSRLARAVELHDVREVHVVGGVSANARLRRLISQAINLPLRFPVKLAYCTDNAAMIAAAGEFLVRELGEKAFDEFKTEAACRQ